jgi:aminotransferase
MKERTIYISGFSKAFAMTGWRLGYICAPKDAIAHLRKIHQYGSLAAPTISQYAALEALKNGQEETEKMKRAYDERRRYLIKALKEMNLDCFAPEGAFYVFPCIKKTGLSSEEFINRLFSEEKAALHLRHRFWPARRRLRPDLLCLFPRQTQRGDGTTCPFRR